MGSWNEENWDCSDLKRYAALEQEVTRLRAERQRLGYRLQHQAVLSGELEDQLVRVLEKNTALTIQNTDLQAQVHHLQHVSAESRAGGHSQTGKPADNLESILKQMREAADKRKELERLHSEALAQLRDTQNYVSTTSNVVATTPVSTEKAKSLETIEALQSKIRELEKKTELQNVRHEELLLEMASIKRSAQGGAATTSNTTAKPTPSWKNRGLQDVSPESDMSTPDSAGRLVDPVGTRSSQFNASAQDYSNMDHQTASGRTRAQTGHDHATSSSSYAQVRSGSPVNQPGGSSQPANSEIDRIMAKIEQDNRILAELDKTRSTIGDSEGNSVASGTGRLLPASRPEQQQQEQQWTNYYLKVPQIKFGTTRKQEHNRMSSVPQPPVVIDHPPPSMDPMSYHPPMLPSQSVAPPMSLHSHHLVSTQLPSYAPKQPTSYMMTGPTSMTNALAAGQHSFMQQPTTTRMMPQIPVGVVAPPIPTILTTQYDLDRLYTTFPGAEHLLGPDNKVVDMLDIPGKGRCYVYIARYSYDPFQQSPNDNPEAELPLHAGDYLLVWGNMDEDGFYDGELLDGRRGLVPSNFIAKLVGEDLLEFHQAAVLGLRDCDDSVSTNVAHEFDFHTPGDASFMMGGGGGRVRVARAHQVKVKSRPVGHSSHHRRHHRQRLPRNSNKESYSKHCMPDYNYIDLEDIFEEEDDALNEQLGEGPVPPPKQLTLERQLNKSVLIGWNPPESANPMDSYHVYVDGVLKTTVKACERTRALVEGVDSNRPHRISVRSITPNRRTSRDAACTMVIGKDVPLGPSHVKATNVTSTSAVISWLPSNSNHQHAVCVNNVEVRTVRPGVYRHTITGLAPNTVYRVTVRAKNIRAPHFDEKQSQQVERFSCHIDFRTLPKGKGLPDPPVDIQVEAGPQDGTLLVTWLPVTMNGSTNGAPVTGYAVYADGKKVTDVDSPTGDHALIDINKLLGLNPKQVTVRTKSRDSQSTDSIATPIPTNALKGKMNKDGIDMKNDRRRYGSAVPAHMRQGHRRDQHGQVIIDTDENLSDKEIYPNHMNIPAIEITKDSASEGNFSEDDYVDGRRGGAARHYDGRGAAPRSHAERGRPPALPHERSGAHQHQAAQQARRDRAMEERDQYYMEGARGDPRNRHGHPGDRGYRGPPPGRGGPQHGPQQGPRDKRMRWFVALFDYDPTTMSPNPDACEEELPFNEGDPIKIYGEKDPDGFYWGECRGRRGYVPHNMVVEVQEMPKNSVDAGRGPHGSNRDRERWGDIYASMPVKKMVALYDYDPQELSPNVDAEQVELTFNTGNIIYVYGEMDDDGFFMGELDGTRGLVPSNFLTEATPEYSGGGGGGGGPRQRGPPPRGHGPGARGPPPPPRDPRMDPRDRRKDACSLPTQIEYRTGEPYHNQGPGAARGRGEGRGGPRGGRGGQPPGGWGGRGHPPDRDYRQQPNQDYRMQDPHQEHYDGYNSQDMHQQDPQHHPPPNVPAASKQPAKPLKGVPAVVPDFVIPNNNEPPPPPTTSTFGTANLPKFPEAPNLMQKFSEMTGGADTSVDNLLSKGKELILMKFGLGK